MTIKNSDIAVLITLICVALVVITIILYSINTQIDQINSKNQQIDSLKTEITELKINMENLVSGVKYDPIILDSGCVAIPEWRYSKDRGYFLHWVIKHNK
jgi:predicted PurR-regulated permease PerM